MEILNVEEMISDYYRVHHVFWRFQLGDNSFSSNLRIYSFMDHDAKKKSRQEEWNPVVLLYRKNKPNYYQKHLSIVSY